MPIDVYRAARCIGAKRLLGHLLQDLAIAFPGASARLDAIVVSFGGTGCTFLLRYISRFMRTNSTNSLDDGLKHVNRPTHLLLRRYKIGKGIYVFDDPRRSVISLFRRKYHGHLRVKLRSNHGTITGYNLDIAGNSVDFEFDGFLAKGMDTFGIIDHWRSWSSAEPVPFPTLFVKFDDLHNSIGKVLDFREIPQHFADDFPAKKPRSSDQVSLTTRQSALLGQIYGAMAEEINSASPVFRRDP